jgi:2-alkenal reductase
MMKTHKLKFVLPVMLLPLLVLACGILTPTSPIAPPAPLTLPSVATVAPVQISVPELTSNEEALLVELYQRVNPSVVNILTYGDQGGLTMQAGQGSGFVFDSQGNIVTNAHVVHGADEIDVVFSDSTILSAKPVGEDLHSDLAVVKVDSLPQGVQSLPLGDMSKVAVGQTVVAIGNPFGLGGTLTKGIVSAMGRTIPALTVFSIPQSIQTDAPINPGNSGGPLLNLKGEVIGVNAQIETEGGSRVNSGVGFAIPVSIVARVIPALIEDGKFEWGWLGVSGGSVTPALVEAMNLPVNRGAYVAEVIRNGPADQAGLRGASREMTVNGRRAAVGGDVIVAIDGVPVGSFDDILIYIALNTSPNQEVKLTIIRDGQTKEVKLTLGLRPTEEIQIQTNP